MLYAHQESLKICDECGEIFDADTETEAFHHQTEFHAPLLPPRRSKFFCEITRARAT